MTTVPKHIDFANWEIFLIALQRVGGGQEMVDVESAFIEAHKLAQKRFSWRTKDIPEIKKLSKALRDADAKGRNYMTGSGNRRQLTAAGLEWIEANKSRINSLNSQRTNLGQSRSTAGHIMLKRVLRSEEYLAWKANHDFRPERWRLAHIFKCSPDSPLETWSSRLEQTGSAAYSEDRKDVRRFLTSIKELLTND